MVYQIRRGFMKQIDLSYLGMKHQYAKWNMSKPGWIERALAHKEGHLMNTGALVIETGKFTGRSPNDRFFVDDEETHDKIDWGKSNMPLSEEKFDALYQKMLNYMGRRDELFVFDGFVGADQAHRMAVRCINQLAGQALFESNLLIEPTEEEEENFNADFTLISAPGFLCQPDEDGTNSEAAIILNFKKKIILIAGSRYCGEVKKAIFTAMNYLLPQQNILPMHCSANMGDDGRTALFFGLSGTGKTTLSADPNRGLIGDDEHGWDDKGIFNFEGGCFAKCINLSKEDEPEIYNAIRFGAVVENVIMNDAREPDFYDDTLTANTRVGYPLSYIPNAVVPSVGGHPSTVIFLTADAFGVLPPVSKLEKHQAMYHFVTGYTSKLAGTERGITEPQTTFSTLFGAPFMPLPAARYAELLGERIDKHNCDVYLINTGWTAGPYGTGHRMKLSYTRAIVTAALNGKLAKTICEHDPIFNVDVPTICEGVPSEILIPKNTWTDQDAYDRTAQKLAQAFINNFKKYTYMPQEIIDAGPHLK